MVASRKSFRYALPYQEGEADGISATQESLRWCTPITDAPFERSAYVRVFAGVSCCRRITPDTVKRWGSGLCDVL